MVIPRFVVGMFSVGLTVLGAGGVCGQTTSTGSGEAYPNKPIRMVTTEPGGPSDLLARLIAQGISTPLAQPVIVDNRGGANGAIAATIVARSHADGYTLLFTGTALWVGPLLQKMPYDPLRDFSPITLAASSPNMIVVHPSSPVKSVKELIALAKNKPGELNYGAGSTGSSPHLAAELFKAMAGVNIVHVPYKGQAPALNDLIGGRLELMFANVAAASNYVKSGSLRALAVTSAEPSALVPGLPTVAASGLSGFESAAAWDMLAPAGTSAMVIDRLQQETARVLNTADAKEKLFKIGAEVIASTPKVVAAKRKSELARMGKVINDVGLRLE